MIYLESPSTDPYFNLALEEYVFESLDQSKSYFMLWHNDNTIVVGKYQNTAEEVNQAYVDQHGIRVARRLSGGGAVYHDKGNLNFTFIMDKKENPDFDFKLFTLPVIRCLKQFGIEAQFNGRNDMTINGQKFSGNSQYMKQGRIMHHGCIMLDSDLSVVAKALRVKPAKFDSKSVKSVRSRVTTINSNAPKPISMEEFKRGLLEEVGKGEPLVYQDLTALDLQAVARLQTGKYSTWEWNYGFSADYDMRREAKFPAGLVTAHLSVRHGVILSARLFGDFFGNGDLSELEHALEGLVLDESLAQALEPLEIGRYINGITPAQLAGLLRG